MSNNTLHNISVLSLLLWSAGLSIDYESDQLWWIVNSPVGSRIMSCSITSFSASSICIPSNFSTNETFNKLTALVVDTKSVYFAQNGTQATIEIINKNGRGRSVLRNNTSGVSAMKMYFANRLLNGMLVSLFVCRGIYFISFFDA